MYVTCSFDGRGGGIRTPDPLVPNQMRYQTALRPDYRLVYPYRAGEAVGPSTRPPRYGCKGFSLAYCTSRCMAPPRCISIHPMSSIGTSMSVARTRHTPAMKSQLLPADRAG